MPVKCVTSPPKPFYQLTIEETVKHLGTDPEKGLKKDRVLKLRAECGSNELSEEKRRSLFLRFLDQFRDLMIIVLIVAAGLAYYLQDFHGGTILVLIIIINAVIGFYQEYKAERILDALKKIVKTKATVIRGGKEMEVDGSELVPGDLIYMEEGSSVPADVRLVKTASFSTNDFILTGESLPQEKDSELLFDRETALTNQDNLVFFGTTVAKGNAYGLVVATGMSTVIGKIARTSSSIVHDKSPLQLEMNHAARALSKIAGLVAVSIFAINMALTFDDQTLPQAIQLSLLFAISVACACVPQGLPAQVTVALSLGVGRLAQKKAIVKKLSAVETLGCTTVICSDKTGTITKNEMTITHCYVNGREFEVTGAGYDPKGHIVENGRIMDKTALEPIKQFFEDGYLASKGHTHEPDDGHASWYAIGDPTEAAFTPLAIKAGFVPEQLDNLFVSVAELPFDSDRKRMTVIHEHKGKWIAFMKGGLDSVLSACNRINHKGDILTLSENEKQTIIASGNQFAAQALRVIALAYRDFEPTPKKDFSVEKTERDFVFAGFVAMIDPPRPEVQEAIVNTYGAHIRLIMITGDNALTARAIAERIGMHDGEALMVVNSDELREKSDADLKQILKERSAIFARVSPEDKFRIVSLLKEMGEVVAVTGDGVNDTLSLKKADIGVAMGLLGSDVAKEAAEIVLLDDNFSTLTVAVREGRVIFENLKKTILNNISGNIGELMVVLIGFAGVALGLPIPILPVQILAVDLIGEILPLTALTFDPGEDTILKRPPRKQSDHVINKKSLLELFFFGTIIGIASYGSFFAVRFINGGSLESAHAAAYVAIILGQWMNILSVRTEETVFTRYLFTNPQLWLSLALSLGLVLTLVYVPTVSEWFGFERLGLTDWIYPILGGAVIILFQELRKRFLPRKG